MPPENHPSPICVTPEHRLGPAELIHLAADVAAACPNGTPPKHRAAPIQAAGRDLESLTASLDAELAELQKSLCALNMSRGTQTATLLDFVAEVRRLSDLVSRRYGDVDDDLSNPRTAVEAGRLELTDIHTNGMVTYL